MELMVSAAISGAATGSIEYTVPNGYTIDTPLIDDGALDFLDGTVHARDATASGNNEIGIPYASDSTTIRMIGPGVFSQYGASQPFTWASGDALSLRVRIPIQEWQGKGIVPMLAEDNLSEWIEFTPSLDNFTNDSALTEGRYRRVGDSIEVAFTATHATGGGSGGDITFDINSNFGLNAAVGLETSTQQPQLQQ
jgi:hypothetical protein